MDYIAKLNLKRLSLNDDDLYNKYIAFLGDNMRKVKTTHYELMQARLLAVAFIERTDGLSQDHFARLRDIAICYYRVNF